MKVVSEFTAVLFSKFGNINTNSEKFLVLGIHLRVAHAVFGRKRPAPPPQQKQELR
jgi:hypothetical protein